MKDTSNILDVASTEMTEAQAEQIASLSEAKSIDLGTITGAGSPKVLSFRKTRPIVKDYKIRRNDECPCGSGKKYKKCCLASGKYETTHTI